MIPVRLHRPARSMRGAMRSQVERIVRTLRPQAACMAVHLDDACAPITEERQRASRLCLTCQVFGAPGWRTAVEFSDFVLQRETPDRRFRQQFLAIDRFTGGGADGLKFDAEASYAPMFSGTITLQLARLAPWAMGLLALTLRDLIEGDITLGFGASKGYGACKARITGIHQIGLETLPEFQTLLQSYEVTSEAVNTLNPAEPPSPELQCVLMECAQAFQEQVKTFNGRVARRSGALPSHA